MREWFTRKKEKPVSEPSAILLPSDVRYALSYREARMGKVEMLALAHNSLPREALYLTMKATVREPDLHKQLLAEAVRTLRTADDSAALRPLLETSIANLKETDTAEGAKLALISRQGFDVWHAAYDKAAAAYATDPREVFLMGHSTFVGLDSFVKAFANKKQFHFLIPDFIENPERTYCGYRITPEGVIEELDSNFDRVPAIIVDDAINTGAAKAEVLAFWAKNGDQEVPDFDAILKTSV